MKTDKYEFSFLAADDVKNDAEHYWFEVGKILDMTELGAVMNYPDAEYCFFRCLHTRSKHFCKCDIIAAFKVIHTQPSISLLQGEIGETG